MSRRISDSDTTPDHPSEGISMQTDSDLTPKTPRTGHVGTHSPAAIEASAVLRDTNFKFDSVSTSEPSEVSYSAAKGNTTRQNILRAAAESMVIQAEEIAKEALLSNVNDTISQAMKPITERLEFLEGSLGIRRLEFLEASLGVAAPAPARRECLKADVGELVAEGIQTFKETIGGQFKELDSKVAKFTKELNEARQRWKYESQQLWEAVDSHTHDVNVEDVEDLQTLPAAVFRGRRTESDPAEEFKGEELPGCNTPASSAVTGPVSVITPSIVAGSVDGLDGVTPEATRHAPGAPAPPVSRQGWPLHTLQLGILPESPVMGSESPLMQNSLCSPSSQRGPLSQRGSFSHRGTAPVVASQKFVGANSSGSGTFQTVDQLSATAPPWVSWSKEAPRMSRGASLDNLGRRGNLLYGTPQAHIGSMPSLSGVSLGSPSMMASNSIRGSPAGSVHLQVAGGLCNVSRDQLGLGIQLSGGKSARARSSPPAAVRELSALVNDTLNAVVSELKSPKAQSQLDRSSIDSSRRRVVSPLCMPATVVSSQQRGYNFPKFSGSVTVAIPGRSPRSPARSPPHPARSPARSAEVDVDVSSPPRGRSQRPMSPGSVYAAALHQTQGAGPLLTRATLPPQSSPKMIVHTTAGSIKVSPGGRAPLSPSAPLARPEILYAPKWSGLGGSVTSMPIDPGNQLRSPNVTSGHSASRSPVRDPLSRTSPPALLRDIAGGQSLLASYRGTPTTTNVMITIPASQTPQSSQDCVGPSITASGGSVRSVSISGSVRGSVRSPSASQAASISPRKSETHKIQSSASPMQRLLQSSPVKNPPRVQNGSLLRMQPRRYSIRFPQKETVS